MRVCVFCVVWRCSLFDTVVQVDPENAWLLRLELRVMYMRVRACCVCVCVCVRACACVYVCVSG